MLVCFLVTNKSQLRRLVLIIPVGISSTNQENYVQILLLVVVSSCVMVMPVCLFFCVFLFSSLRLFEELFLRERERIKMDRCRCFARSSCLFSLAWLGLNSWIGSHSH
jgi:hypothetical protein